MIPDSINVLDHGFVRLVDSMGNDLSIVRSARVSYDAEWRAGTDKGSDARLINYLWKNKHTSPFESVEFQFEIKAPIFVFRQWHRHRTWSFNEVSARYTELPEEFYVPEAALIGRQSHDNKQMRILDDATPVYAEMVRKMIAENNKECFEVYHALLTEGCPRELARSVLPVGTYSRMFGKIDLKNLFDFLRLRSHEHAQHEIRVYAEAMLKLIQPTVPEAVKAWRLDTFGVQSE
jgi:thymidylate synthase (FAD)